MKLDKYNIHKYIEVTGLYCSSMGVTSIEDIPDYITHIYCYENNLTSLPKLPSGLVYLNCDNNNLTSLPMLPDSLVYLWCYKNNLTSYPSYSKDKKWMIEHNKWLHRIEIINKINDTGFK